MLRVFNGWYQMGSAQIARVLAVAGLCGSTFMLAMDVAQCFTIGERTAEIG